MITSIYSNRHTQAAVSHALREAISVGRWTWRIGCAVALFALTVDFYVWSAPPRIVQFVAGPLGLGDQVTISPGVQVLGLLLALVPLCLGCYALLQLRRLYQALLSLTVFGDKFIWPLRRFAFALIGLAVCDVLVRAGNSILLTHLNPPGKQMLLIGFSNDTLLHVVVALLLLALTAVLREAVAIVTEHQQFV